MPRIKTVHFAIAFVFMIIVTNLIGAIKLKTIPELEDCDKLEELEASLFRDITSKDKMVCVLLYNEDSDLCKKMEYEMRGLLTEKRDVEFYKMDVNNYPDKHHISGVPSLVLYKQGVEKERVLGVVSKSNLKMIMDRIEQ